MDRENCLAEGTFHISYVIPHMWEWWEGGLGFGQNVVLLQNIIFHVIFVGFLDNNTVCHIPAERMSK